MSVIEESCGDRASSGSRRVPARRSAGCSSGTVMNSSTSAAESPSVGVWISTRGGANSGKTSTRASPRSSSAPKTISAAAASTTRCRNLRLDATIQRIMCRSILLLVVDPELRPVQLGRAHGHDRRAGRRARERSDRVVPSMRVDLDRARDEDERLRARVDPGRPVRVVERAPRRGRPARPLPPVRATATV